MRQNPFILCLYSFSSFAAPTKNKNINTEKVNTAAARSQSTSNNTATETVSNSLEKNIENSTIQGLLEIKQKLREKGDKINEERTELQKRSVSASVKIDDPDMDERSRNFLTIRKLETQVGIHITYFKNPAFGFSREWQSKFLQEVSSYLENFDDRVLTDNEDYLKTLINASPKTIIEEADDHFKTLSRLQNKVNGIDPLNQAFDNKKEVDKNAQKLAEIKEYFTKVIAPAYEKLKKEKSEENVTKFKKGISKLLEYDLLEITQEKTINNLKVYCDQSQKQKRLSISGNISSIASTVTSSLVKKASFLTSIITGKEDPQITTINKIKETLKERNEKLDSTKKAINGALKKLVNGEVASTVDINNLDQMLKTINEKQKTLNEIIGELKNERENLKNKSSDKSLSVANIVAQFGTLDKLINKVNTALENTKAFILTSDSDIQSMANKLYKKPEQSKGMREVEQENAIASLEYNPATSHNPNEMKTQKQPKEDHLGAEQNNMIFKPHSTNNNYTNHPPLNSTNGKEIYTPRNNSDQNIPYIKGNINTESIKILGAKIMKHEDRYQQYEGLGELKARLRQYQLNLGNKEYTDKHSATLLKDLNTLYSKYKHDPKKQSEQNPGNLKDKTKTNPSSKRKNYTNNELNQAMIEEDETANSNNQTAGRRVTIKAQSFRQLKERTSFRQSGRRNSNYSLNPVDPNNTLEKHRGDGDSDDNYTTSGKEEVAKSHKRQSDIHNPDTNYTESSEDGEDGINNEMYS